MGGAPREPRRFLLSHLLLEVRAAGAPLTHLHLLLRGRLRPAMALSTAGPILALRGFLTAVTARIFQAREHALLTVGWARTAAVLKPGRGAAEQRGL